MMSYLETILIFLLIPLIAIFLGKYIYQIASEKAFLHSTFLHRIDSIVLRMCNIKNEMQSWKEYFSSLIFLHCISGGLVFIIFIFQENLPLNPQNFPNLDYDLALNIVISFATGTNLQGYAGEQTLSHLSQMIGISWLSFLSAATGISVVFAVARGIANHANYYDDRVLGNYSVDLIRSIVFILLPLSMIMSIIFIFSGCNTEFIRIHLII